MVVLGCCCRENHHEGGCRCLETDAAAGGRKRTKQQLLLGAVREEGRAAATMAAHRWRKNMWLVVVVCRSGGMREGKRREEGKGRRVLSEGRSTHNPNPSFYIIYTLIYLFIYLPRFIFLRGPTKKLTFVCSHILIK